MEANKKTFKYFKTIAILFTVVFCLFILSSSAQAQAANHYIRDGANGSSPCTGGWGNNDACDSLPATLIRGDTYYIADGTYPAYTFSGGGTQYIYIKKAIGNINEEGHGTNNGWKNEYGDEQAIFTDTLKFNSSSYYVFDGQIGGGPDNWNSGHGFKIDIVDWENTPALDYMGIHLHKGSNNITIAHTEFDMHGGAEITGKTAVYSVNDNNNITLRYNYLHHSSGGLIVDRDSDDWLIEYNFFQRPSMTETSSHSEIFSVAPSRTEEHSLCNNWTVRYNIFEDWRSTGGLMFYGWGWEIYGNVFYRNEYTIKARHGAIGTWSYSENNYFIDVCPDKICSKNHKIYNNTIFNGQSDIGADNIFPLGQCVNCEARNNLWNNSPGFYRIFNPTKPEAFTDSVHSHNAFFDSNGDSFEEDTKQVSTGNPFVNLLAKDYRLTKPTNDGYHLSEPFNKDMFGNTRGQDRTWDRGAFEYDPNQLPQTSITGDLNNNDIVDPNDIQLCINVFLEIEKRNEFVLRADVNNDGDINVIDIQKIVNLVLE